MKRSTIIAGLAALALAAPVVASAHVEVSVGLGFPTFGYYVPAPRYYQPPPTVYYGQSRVIYQTPYWGDDWRDDDDGGWHRRDGWRGDNWHRRDGRRGDDHHGWHRGGDDH